MLISCLLAIIFFVVERTNPLVDSYTLHLVFLPSFNGTNIVSGSKISLTIAQHQITIFVEGLKISKGFKVNSHR